MHTPQLLTKTFWHNTLRLERRPYAARAIRGIWPTQARQHLAKRAGQLPGNNRRWLADQPLWLVVIIGAVVGLGLGLPGFFFLRSPLWGLVWVLVFGALGWLGWRAEPVFWEAIPEAPKPRPAPRPGPHQVRDGPLVMMALPGGPFWMGSPDTDNMAGNTEKPQHQVTVSALRIAITPVTAGLYAEVMGKETPAADRAQLPAVEVSWYDAIEFCNALSVRQGYRPCYHREGEQVVCDWQADGYRLPTEAEWEYACRAGTTTRYAFGDDPAQLERYAWFGKAYSEGPFAVAQKLPHPWGLYDMHGNVWEWCWDWFGPYDQQSLRDPHGPSEGLADTPCRVVRGGSFDYPPEHLRSAVRDFFHPESRGRYGGFRCVRVPPNMPLSATPCSACQGVDALYPGLPVPVAWRPSGQATR